MKFGGSGMTKNCYDWIVANVEHGTQIVEFGAGKVSTKVLSEKWKVFSVEQDSAYVGIYEGVDYVDAPLKDGWYDAEKVFENFPDEFSLLIIDGPLYGDRTVITKYFDRMNLKDAFVIVDDVYRDEIKSICQELESLGKSIIHVGEDESIPGVNQFAVMR